MSVVEEKRVETGGMRLSDRLALFGAAAAAIAFTALITTQIFPFDGFLGFVVIAWVTFVLFYGVLAAFDSDGPAVRDRIASAIMHSFGLVLLITLATIITFTLYSGREALPHWNFFVSDMAGTLPTDSLSKGGILHGIMGSLMQITMALTITIPLGITCAVFLSELPGRFSRFVRTIVEAMTALPSIVAGLFVYATYILLWHNDKSGFAAALAISVMMLPIIIRAADVVLRLVPGTLKEASLALGASQWRTVWHVVLPTARSGLATSVILGTARGIGETSPVLLTAGLADAVNWDPLHEEMTPLPLLTFSMVRSSEAEMISRGFGAAAVLLVLVLGLFIVARVIGGRGPGELSRGAMSRRMRGSQIDAKRIAARSKHLQEGRSHA